MRALITGMGGTVGQALASALRARGGEAVAYCREGAAFDEPAVIGAQIAAAAPDVVFHLAIASKPVGLENEAWRINVEWPERLAELCRAAGVRFIVTSTAMVFSNDARRARTIDSP